LGYAESERYFKEPGEIHLRDQARQHARAEQRKMDMRRAPRIVVVRPRVGAGLDGLELVPALGVGDGTPGAGEVRVERRVVQIARVVVAAARWPARSPPRMPGTGRPFSSSTRP